MSSYIAVGSTKKTHGLKGELKFVLEDKFADDFFEQDAIFVEVKGQKIPYFIEYFRGEGAYILKLEDVNDVQTAKLLTHKYIFMKSEDIQLTEDEMNQSDLEYSDLKGYTLVDQTAGEIGEVLAVEDFPQQEMAVVLYKGNEILIPLNPQLIVEEDTSTRKLTLDLPEGLLDL